MRPSVFIAHAHEDKRDVADPLAAGLRNAGYQVWYDRYILRTGDNLRQKIDRGLAQCDFGVVVLSHNFFAKRWPQYELDGLAQRQMTSGQRIILPVWHGLEKDDVLRYSPPLAGIVASRTSSGIGKVVAELIVTIQESQERGFVSDAVTPMLDRNPVVTPLRQEIGYRPLPGSEPCSDCGWESLEFAALSLCPACGLAPVGCG
jgi:hypothetical protein